MRTSEGVESWTINPEEAVADTAVSEQARCERIQKGFELWHVSSPALSFTDMNFTTNHAAY